MDIYKLPYFEDIDLDSVKDYYSVGIPYRGYTLELDLNFNDESAIKDSLESVKRFIDNLSDYDLKASGAIRKDYDAGETVKDYIEHHLEDIDKDELDELLKDTDKSIAVEEQLFSKLTLVRIGFYPEDEVIAIFDYTIGRDLTQYLIVVQFDGNGSVVDIQMES